VDQVQGRCEEMVNSIAPSFGAVSVCAHQLF
jgi:hypothetical protein